MIKTFICCPIEGEHIQENIANSWKYTKEVMKLGEFPINTGGYFCSFLRDSVPEERLQGMRMGIGLLKASDKVRIFGDHISAGMKEELSSCLLHNIPVYKGVTNQQLNYVECSCGEILLLEEASCIRCPVCFSKTCSG